MSVWTPPRMDDHREAVPLAPAFLERPKPVVERRLRLAVITEAAARPAACTHLAGNNRNLSLIASYDRFHQQFGHLDGGFRVDAVYSGGAHAVAVDTRAMDQDVDRFNP